MATFNWTSTIKRLRSRYRLVVMNEDTFEEIAFFKLNRLSVYVAICAIFVLLVGATIAVLWFTPLKQLTPGFKQGFGVDAKYKQLKIESDAVFAKSKQQEQYIENLKKILNNEQATVQLDTAILQIENEIAPPSTSRKIK